MYLCVKWNHLSDRIFSAGKLILKVSTVPNQFNGSISKSAVNLEKIRRGQIFGLSRDPLAIFKTCSDTFNMGCVCSVMMPGMPRDPTKFQDD